MKRCGTCQEDKPLIEFGRDRAAKDGLRHYCKPCNNLASNGYRQRHLPQEAARMRRYREVRPERFKESDLRRLYGIRLADYEAMLVAQGFRCAICHQACGTGRQLSVDHDPVTGCVRGLLCSNCNNGIGRLGHDPERLRRAAEYIEAPR